MKEVQKAIERFRRTNRMKFEKQHKMCKKQQKKCKKKCKKMQKNAKKLKKKIKDD
jgi:hypothetical protein